MADSELAARGDDEDGDGERGGGEAAALVAAARRGDDAAWRLLVSRYMDLVWSIARGHSLSHCDAADVTQTTWLRLHEHLPRLREPDRVVQWLMTTARRESLRLRRERQRNLPDPAPQPNGAVPPADEDLPAIVAERDKALWRAFRQLSPTCQTLLRALSAEEPPTYSDLGATLGMPVGSIGPTRSRCLDRLRASLLALGAPGTTADEPGVEEGS